MDPSTAHHQEMMMSSINQSSSSSPSAAASLENMLVCSNTKSSSLQQDIINNKKPRPQPDQALKCPRCDSTNTKFCYYNNYSLSQPRYFCKSCRRYWTKGGTLRNVPVGGGCRKNKRSSSSSSSSSSAAKSKFQDHQPVAVPVNVLPPHLGYDTNDLSLAFARLQKHHHSNSFDHLQDHHHDDHHHFSMLGCDVLGNPSMMTSGSATTTAFLDALRSSSNFMGTTQNANFIHPNGFHHTTNYGFGGQDQVQQQDQQQQQQQNIGMAFEDGSNTTMKQEISCTDHQSRGGGGDADDESSRVLWGFPWQQLSHGGSADHHHHHHHHLGSTTMSDQIDTARESWNSSTNFTSAWHGLLNTPLM